MTKYLALLAVLTCACIQPPDDGMSLGPETSATAINSVMDDAQSGITEEQSFHIGDSGVMQLLETVFSSSKLKENDVFTITDMDDDFIYFSDYKVRANKTTRYKLAREKKAVIANPPFTPASGGSSAFFKILPKAWADWIVATKEKIALIVKKISIEPSTALAEKTAPVQRKMANEDIFIKEALLDAASSGSTPNTDPVVQVDSPQPDEKVKAKSDNTIFKYYGLQSYKHTYITNNCSQIKDCKVNATHIEFNEVDITPDKSIQVHWVYEISKEVPGLFRVLSRCGSTIVIVNNGQVPYMQCQILDTFQFGTGLR